MTFDAQLDLATVRLYEECAEELARLDALVSLAPPAVASVLQTITVAQLATSDAQATRAACASLVASRVELVHAAALSPVLDGWQQRVDDGERRARSGALPTLLPALAPDATEVAEALRPGGMARPLLMRALHVFAWSPDPASADLLAALLLAAGGLTDRLRLLPFVALRADVGADASVRAAAVAAWRAGDPEPLTQLALPRLAAAARQLRLQVKLLLEAQAPEDLHLASIGRAAGTARDALAVLRTSLATSVPDLSARLALSRPAAGAALERLVALGLAEEITGRGRDRVFVYAGAWGLL